MQNVLAGIISQKAKQEQTFALSMYKMTLYKSVIFHLFLPLQVTGKLNLIPDDFGARHRYTLDKAPIYLRAKRQTNNYSQPGQFKVDVIHTIDWGLNKQQYVVLVIELVVHGLHLIYTLNVSLFILNLVQKPLFVVKLSCHFLCVQRGWVNRALPS